MYYEILQEGSSIQLYGSTRSFGTVVEARKALEEFIVNNPYENYHNSEFEIVKTEVVASYRVEANPKLVQY